MECCRACRARLIWAETTRGKRIPLDLLPTMSGNIVLEARDGQPPLARLVAARQYEFGDAMPESEPLRYLSHFVTCPAAKDFRKKP